ncbi:MAG: DNA repair protein RadA [Deltaproteobacteria bacterium]|nr:DNA repair protein RadA [Deltaproteobacteria bacterium]
MAKVKTLYTCRLCGYSAPKWLGRCPECLEWESLVEERSVRTQGKALIRMGSADSLPVDITETKGGLAEEDRVKTGTGEFDRVLGGGMVKGSAILVGGDPGIGKSTLLLQSLGAFAGRGHSVLYVTGEESVAQIRLRAERLGVVNKGLKVWAETSVERIADKVEELRPEVVVFDSVQTFYSDTVEAAPGSVAQVREISCRLISVAKSLNIPIFLVGHVTKDGNIAGPKILEHMVDTVLYFEGESGHIYRVLRAVKNRFGSVMEIGVFEMKTEGLVEVENPSEVFLAERPEGASGSSVVASLEGTRTVLVEIQALVAPALFGVPRRTVVGVDYNKVLLLAAILEKKAGITLASHDIFVKVSGGMKIDEPASDLAIIAALSSNFMDKAVSAGTVIFGEVGLAGEIRGVTQPEARLKEAAKLGFKRAILPRGNLKGISSKAVGIKLIDVSTVKEALDVFFK